MIKVEIFNAKESKNTGVINRWLEAHQIVAKERDEELLIMRWEQVGDSLHVLYQMKPKMVVKLMTFRSMYESTELKEWLADMEVNPNFRIVNTNLTMISESETTTITIRDIYYEDGTTV